MMNMDQSAVTARSLGVGFAKTPNPKKALRAVMLKHADDLDKDGHADLAKAARSAALESPADARSLGKPDRQPLSHVQGQNLASPTPSRGANWVTAPNWVTPALREWLASDAEGSVASTPSPDRDIDDPTVKDQLAALRQGMMRQLGGKNTPGLEREVVPGAKAKLPPPPMTSPIDALWNFFENGATPNRSPSPASAAGISPPSQRAQAELWDMWEAEAPPQRPAASPRVQLTGALLLAVAIALTAIAAALVLYPTSAGAAPLGVPPATLAAARPTHGRGAATALATVRGVACGVGADAVRAVLALLKKLGRLLNLKGRKPVAA